MLFSELSTYLQMELEKDCKLIEYALCYHATHFSYEKPIQQSRIITLMNNDIDSNVEFLRDLAKKVCLSTGTETITNNKDVICESLKFYCRKLEYALSQSQEKLQTKSLPFNRTQKEINDCKKLLDCLC